MIIPNLTMLTMLEGGLHPQEKYSPTSYLRVSRHQLYFPTRLFYLRNNGEEAGNCIPLELSFAKKKKRHFNFYSNKQYM